MLHNTVMPVDATQGVLMARCRSAASDRHQLLMQCRAVSKKPTAGRAEKPVTSSRPISSHTGGPAASHVSSQLIYLTKGMLAAYMSV